MSNLGSTMATFSSSPSLCVHRSQHVSDSALSAVSQQAFSGTSLRVAAAALRASVARPLQRASISRPKVVRAAADGEGAVQVVEKDAPVAAPGGEPAAADSAPKAGPRGGNIHLDPKEIILIQGFNWESPKVGGGWYSAVSRVVDDLKAVGITDVWLPPPSKSVDRNGYLPSQLYNLDASSFGDEASLKALIDRLHGSGLRVHADIVINHRCGDFQDEHGNWTIFEGGTPDERLDWGPWAIVAGDQPYGGQGNQDTGEDYGAAPDIDHTNPRVQDELTKWLLWLKHDIGFDGWRFDFVKGYGGEYVGLYCERTEPVFAVGELWGNMNYDNGGLAYDQDGHRQQLVDWVDKTKGWSAAFDFTTKGILQEACRNTEFWRLRDHCSRPSGMIGYWPARAVTFIDNHDTGSSQGHWPFPSDKVMQGYAYILTHPGVPCLFWDHIFDWGHKDKISKLVALRKRNGINAESPVQILAADADLYLAKIGNNVVLKLGPRFDLGNLLPNPDEFQIAVFGDGYAAWERK